MELMRVEIIKILNYGICLGLKLLRFCYFSICGKGIMWNGIEINLLIFRFLLYYRLIEKGLIDYLV